MTIPIEDLAQLRYIPVIYMPEDALRSRLALAEQVLAALQGHPTPSELLWQRALYAAAERLGALQAELWKVGHGERASIPHDDTNTE